MFRKRGRLRRAAAAGLCALMALQTPVMTARAELPEQLTVTNGQFIRANGTAVEGRWQRALRFQSIRIKQGRLTGIRFAGTA